MKLDIRRVFELEGDPEGLSFERALSLEGIRLGGMAPFLDPVRVSGRLLNRAGVVTLDLTVTGERHGRCDRCLEEWREPYDRQFSHTVVRRLQNEADEDEYLVCPDGMLDLEEVVYDDVGLSLPSVQLCREDCKGLCPVCGKNLNHESCGCVADRGDPRLQILRELLK